MNKRIISILGFLFFAAVAAAAPANSEIEALLGYLKALDGAVFIRNGTEHSAVDAEAHLRMKWQKQSDKIKSAEDFIALCGSKSSVSGQRYQIRFKDGQLRYSDDVLAEWLGEIRKKANSSPGLTPKSAASQGPRHFLLVNSRFVVASPGRRARQSI